MVNKILQQHGVEEYTTYRFSLKVYSLYCIECRIETSVNFRRANRRFYSVIAAAIVDNSQRPIESVYNCLYRIMYKCPFRILLKQMINLLREHGSTVDN